MHPFYHRTTYGVSRAVISNVRFKEDSSSASLGPDGTDTRRTMPSLDEATESDGFVLILDIQQQRGRWGAAVASQPICSHVTTHGYIFCMSSPLFACQSDDKGIEMAKRNRGVVGEVLAATVSNVLTHGRAGFPRVAAVQFAAASRAASAVVESHRVQVDPRRIAAAKQEPFGPGTVDDNNAEVGYMYMYMYWV